LKISIGNKNIKSSGKFKIELVITCKTKKDNTLNLENPWVSVTASKFRSILVEKAFVHGK
jgi:hypothetical protein